MARLLLLLGVLPAASGAPVVYPAAPNVTLDARASLACDGFPIPLAYEAGSDVRAVGPPPLPSSRARWASDGVSRCALTVEGAGGGGAWVLRAAGRDVPFSSSNSEAAGEAAGGTATTFAFALDGPGNYYLRSATRRYYLWVDPLSALAAPAGAVELGTDGTGSTGWLAAACESGAPVVLGPGVHGTGAATLPANATLFLRPGAVLRYDGSDARGAGAFLGLSSKNTLAGVGAIEANGFPGRGVEVVGARGVRIGALFLSGSRGWAVHVLASSDVNVTGARIFSGADGVDPDSSSDVLITNVFVHAWDDAIAVKATVAGAPAERIRVEGCVVSTRKSAFKLGTESESPLRDVAFERSDAFDAGRGLVIYAKDGGDVRGVLYRDLRVDFYDYANEKIVGRAIDFQLEHRDGYSTAANVTVSRVDATWFGPAVVRGNDVASLGGVALDGLKIDVREPYRAAAGAADRPFLFDCHNADIARDGVVAARLAVRWRDNEPLWAGLSKRWPGWPDALQGPASLCPDPPNPGGVRRQPS